MRIAIGLMWLILSMWGRYSANLIFKLPATRPRSFSGNWGSCVFFLLNISILVSPFAGIPWILRTFPFWLSPLIIVGGVVIGFVTYPLAVSIAGAAGVFLSSSLILSGLNYVAWRVFRPLSPGPLSAIAALGVAYVISGAVTVWWDSREPYSNRPPYLRRLNPLAMLAVALAWLPWTFRLLWMELRYTKQVHSKPDSMEESWARSAAVNTWYRIFIALAVFCALTVLLGPA